MTTTTATTGASKIASKPASAKNSTARGAAWSTMAFVVIGVGQLLVQALLKRDSGVTKADLGIVTATVVIIGFGKIFTTTGVGPAIVQRDDLDRRHIETGFIISVATGILAFGVLALGAPLIAGLFKSDRLQPLLWMLGLATFVQSLGIVAEGLLQREFRFKALAIAETISFGVGFIGFGAVLAISGAGIWTMVYANLAQAVLKAGFVLAATRHPIGTKVDRDAGRDLAKFATGFTLAKIFNFAGVNGDNVVIGNRMGPVSLGTYGYAYNLLAMPAMFFGQIVDRVLFPVMARMQHDIPKLAQTYRRGVAGIATVTGPGGALIMVLAPEIVHLIYGPDSGEVVNPLRAFALGLTLRTGYKISDSLARSSGTVFKRAKRQAVYAVLVVVGAYVGHFWGITAAAIGVLFALLANYLLMADLSLRTTGLSWRSFAAAHWRGAVLGALTGIVGSAISIPMRNADMNFFVILAATMLGVAAMLGILVVVRRDLVLGDVEWLLKGAKSGTADALDGGGVADRGDAVVASKPTARRSTTAQPPTAAAGNSKSAKATAPMAKSVKSAARKSPAPNRANAPVNRARPSQVGPDSSRTPTPRTPPRVSAKSVYSATSAPTKSASAKPEAPKPAPTRSETPTRPGVVQNDQSAPDAAAAAESSRSVVRPTRSAKSSVARPRVDYEKVDLLALALKIADTEPAGRRGTKKNTARTASNPPAADPGANRG